MTTPDDYSDAMPNQIDDAAAEALLTGRGVATGLEPVAAVVRMLREVADRPVPPGAALAAQMAAGVFAGAPERYRAPAPGPQGRGLGAAARRGVHEFVPGLAAVPRKLAAVPRKLLAMSLAAKAFAVVLAAALVGGGSAGFAGTLPEPVQDQFETVVESVSPYEFSRPGPPGSGPGPRRGGNPAPAGGAEPGEWRRPTDLPTPATTSAPPPTGQPEPHPGQGPPERPGNRPTEHPGQGSPDRPGNRPTEHPGQGEPRRPTAPPGQNRGAG